MPRGHRLLRAFVFTHGPLDEGSIFYILIWEVHNGHITLFPPLRNLMVIAEIQGQLNYTASTLNRLSCSKSMTELMLPSQACVSTTNKIQNRKNSQTSVPKVSGIHARCLRYLTGQPIQSERERST